VTLPEQTVDRAGYISVPYAGQILAAGRGVAEIQRDIEAKLGNRAIEPQAVVALVSQSSSQATLIGELNAPGKISLN
ncbi:polysaccharide biosynthesis/export family protein, partial [Mycobacterium tuberculosis]|nr:polysaccharide biosynthesis/export family protein [Mycobacterium tuberculosis]